MPATNSPTNFLNAIPRRKGPVGTRLAPKEIPRGYRDAHESAREQSEEIPEMSNSPEIELADEEDEDIHVVREDEFL